MWAEESEQILLLLQSEYEKEMEFCGGEITLTKLANMAVFSLLKNVIEEKKKMFSSLSCVRGVEYEYDEAHDFLSDCFCKELLERWEIEW